jgi:lysozyme family protein
MRPPGKKQLILESGADFATYLGNGEPLNRVTQLVPKGPRAVYQLGSRRHRR